MRDCVQCSDGDQGYLCPMPDVIRYKFEMISTLTSAPSSDSRLETGTQLDAMLPSILDKAFRGKL